ASAASPTVNISLAKFSLVTVAGAPVNAAGVAQPGQNWGQWSAVPGTSNVQSTNYLKLTNDGDKPAVSVGIDFTEPAFAGATANNFSIPLDGNVQFAWAEGSPSASPSSLTFTFAPASGSGSVTPSFTAKGNV